MFNRSVTASLMRMVWILAFSYILPVSSYSQTGDAQPSVLANFSRLFPPFVERFMPGGPVEEAAAKEKPVIYYKSAKRISAAYEGYAIQLIEVDRPLLQDNSIFKQFGNVVYDRTESGKYSYLIQVQFSTRQAVDAFYENIIKPKCPSAKIVSFEKGKATKEGK